MKKVTQIWINTRWIIANYSVHRNTVFYWRKVRGLKYHERKRREEFGTRREVLFKYIEFKKWAKEHGIEPKKSTRKKQRKKTA